MSDSHYQSNSDFTALKISLIYFIVSLIWILASDQIISIYITSPQLLTMLASFKGTLFIIATSILIYILVNRAIKKREKAEKALIESEKKYKWLFESSPSYLILVGANGRLMDVNEAAVNFVGRTKEDLVGRHFSEVRVMPEDELPLHYDNISQILKGGQVEPYKSRYIDKNGEIHYAITTESHLEKNGKIFGIQIIVVDITDLKKAEDEIKESLREKEVLLREIHHRVKNNLQIISSLLNLQTEYVDGDESLDILMESKNRVQTMALIHEELYKSSSLKDVKFKDFIYSLISNIFYSYGVDSGIERIIDVEDLNMGIDTAIPCGLIINELVTNSIKYAFPKGKGVLEIKLQKKRDKFNLIVSDNGIGLPKGIEIENTETLGLKMVESLVNQLDGSLELERVNGTKFIINFKELKYKDRI